MSLSLIAASCSNNDAELQALREQVDALSASTTVAATTASGPFGILSPQISDYDYKEQLDDCVGLSFDLLDKILEHQETFDQRIGSDGSLAVDLPALTFIETQTNIDRALPNARAVGAACETKFPLLFGAYFTSIFESLDACVLTYTSGDVDAMKDCLRLLAVSRVESELTGERMLELGDWLGVDLNG